MVDDLSTENTEQRSAYRVRLIDSDAASRETNAQLMAARGLSVADFEYLDDALDRWTEVTSDIVVFSARSDDAPVDKTIQTLSGRTREPIVVIVSNEDIASTAIAGGANACLVEPISESQLVVSVQAALARAEPAAKAHRPAQDDDSEDSLAAALIEQFAFGVAIIDEQMHVRCRNTVLGGMLSAGDLLQLRNNRLAAMQENDLVSFANFVESLVHSDRRADPVGSVTVLGRESPGRHLQVWGGNLVCPKLAVPNRYILLFVDPGQHTPLPSDVLRSLYGLTVTESRLAEALVNGTSIEQFATQSKTSYNTARSHLKSIFVKTRTNRQVDLVRLLTPMVGCLYV